MPPCTCGLQVAVDVDAVKWSMCHDRTPFFASALSSLKLAMTRNEDNSGKCLFCPCQLNPPSSMTTVMSYIIWQCC
jgi:hypothetical protein